MNCSQKNKPDNRLLQEDEDRYLLWEDLRLDDMTPSPMVFSTEAFQKFATTIRDFLFGSWKTTVGRVPIKKPTLIDRLPSIFKRHIPSQVTTSTANKKFLHKKPKDNTVPVGEKQKKLSLIVTRLKEHVRTPEFWLGILFGVATRLATRMTIQASFPPSQRMSATVIGVIACACAGLAAGMVVHFVRTFYRNSRAAPGEEKQKYVGRVLFESALIGLFGGIIGGGTTNFGAMIANSGSFAIGATGGGLVGVLHAGVKGIWKSREQKTGTNWWQLAFQGVAFGAVGGVLGGISSDVISANESVAATVGQTGDVIYTPPASVQYLQDPCGSACGTLISQPTVVIEPIHTVPVGPPPVASHPADVPVERHVQKPVHHTAQKHMHTHKHTHTQPQKTVCHPVEKVKHVKHLKHLRHAKPVIHHAPPVASTVLPLPVSPPPQSVVPIVGPATPMIIVPQTPINPCASEACEVPCRTSEIIIKGPCGDPRVPCVERVSYNDNGDASVVLERAGHTVTKPHFEVAAAKVTTDSPHWNKGVHNTAPVDSKATPDVTKVSFVMPFVHPSYAQVASSSPIPA